MKTVLAPNAPWPYKVEEAKVEVAKPAPKKRAPRPPKKESKMQKTNAKFDEWARKNIIGEIK